MLEVGGTYINKRGCPVKILGGGQFRGEPFLIAKVTHPGTGDQVAAYTRNGNYMPPANNKYSSDMDIELARRFVDLQDAISLIRSRLQSTTPDIGTIIRDLEAMPFKELTNA